MAGFIRNRHERDNEYSKIGFWIFACAVVVVLLLAIFKVNSIWGFIVSIVLGIVVFIGNILFSDQQRWIVIEYTLLIIGLNTITTMLTLMKFSSLIYTLLYFYMEVVLGIAVVLLGIYVLYKED